jgi:formamidopyrimidine-DNA glycosylase
MIKLPEATVIARQITEELRGKKIESCIRGNSPHKFDLYNHPGKYRKILDSRQVGKPCPECGTSIEKQQYLGGAVYYFPSCQNFPKP